MRQGSERPSDPASQPEPNEWNAEKTGKQAINERSEAQAERNAAQPGSGAGVEASEAAHTDTLTSSTKASIRHYH